MFKELKAQVSGRRRNAEGFVARGCFEAKTEGDESC